MRLVGGDLGARVQGKITAATNVRKFIAALLPAAGFGHQGADSQAGERAPPSREGACGPLESDTERGMQRGKPPAENTVKHMASIGY